MAATTAPTTTAPQTTPATTTDGTTAPRTAPATIADGPTAPPPDAAPKSPPKPASTLADEVHRIDAARAALRDHRAARALELLDAYDRQYPTGALAPEAAVARIDATRAAGDIAHARELATAFLAAHPGSPLAARVRALIAP